MPTFTEEGDLSVSAPRLWNAMKDSTTIFPKIAPQIFASIQDEAGAGIGGIRIIKFGPAAPPGTYAKEKLTAIDPEKYSATTEEVEGGHLKEGFSKWVTTTKFIPIDDKSSKFHVTVDYEGDNQPLLAQAKEGYGQLFKGLCGYIESNNA